MKILNKVLTLTALAVGMSAVSAQDYELTFSNKTSTNIVDYTKTKIEGESKSASQFSGITNKAEAELLSERVDIGAMAEFTFSPIQSTDDALKENDKDGFSFELSDYDYYIEFRPIHQITLGYRSAVYAWGSYLPVWDDNLAGANFTTSEGLSVVVRPIDDLRIGAGFEPSTFGLDKKQNEDEEKVEKLKPIINLGADYNFQNLVKAGFALRNVAGSWNYNKEDDAFEERKLGFGAFVEADPIEGLVLNLGFAHNDYDGIGFALIDNLDLFSLQGENIATLGASFEQGPLTLALDTALNFKADGETDGDASYDTYIGASVGFNVTEDINVSLTGIFGIDRDSANTDKADTYIGVNPSASFTFAEHHEVGLGFQFEKAGDYSAFNFPIYYKYSF